MYVEDVLYMQRVFYICRGYFIYVGWMNNICLYMFFFYNSLRCWCSGNRCYMGGSLLWVYGDWCCVLWVGGGFVGWVCGFDGQYVVGGVGCMVVWLQYIVGIDWCMVVLWWYMFGRWGCKGVQWWCMLYFGFWDLFYNIWLWCCRFCFYNIGIFCLRSSNILDFCMWCLYNIFVYIFFFYNMDYIYYIGNMNCGRFFCLGIGVMLLWQFGRVFCVNL